MSVTLPGPPATMRNGRFGHASAARTQRGAASVPAAAIIDRQRRRVSSFIESSFVQRGDRMSSL